MDNILKKVLSLIVASLGLALMFNLLFFDQSIGISVFIFIVIFLGVMVFFATWEKLDFRNVGWLIFLLLFFSLMLAIRANEFLNFLNFVAIFGLLMLLANHLTGISAVFMRFIDYIFLMILVPFRMLGRALGAVSFVGRIQSKVKQRDLGLRIFKGVLMALPILIIFSLLFSSADLVFSQFIQDFVDINISERSMQYMVLLLFAFLASLSYLSYLFLPLQAQFVSSGKEAKESFGQTESVVVGQSGKSIEVLVFLGLIAALFLLFIGFQITYLFGGEMNITGTGFTYAEYARRGFWELLAVAILSLLVLLFSEKYAGVSSKRDKKFLLPSLILIAEVMVVIMSAFKRLSLYIDAYGMTTLRFYVFGFILLLLLLFVLLAIKFIQARQEQFFAFGTLLSVIGFLMIVNVVNPDAFIARSNIERYNRTGKLDIFYFKELSADAVPEKVELYKQLEGENKEVLRKLLQKQKDRLQRNKQAWQSVNFSRIRAVRALEELEK